MICDDMVYNKCYVLYNTCYVLYNTYYVLKHMISYVLTHMISYRIYSINRPGRLLNFWTLRVGAYSRWALIKFSTFSASVVCLFCNKTINGKNKTRRCNKARFL